MRAGAATNASGSIPLGHPCARQIQATHARVVADVARDVGQLRNGDAEIVARASVAGSLTPITSAIIAPTVPATRAA